MCSFFAGIFGKTLSFATLAPGNIFSIYNGDETGGWHNHLKLVRVDQLQKSKKIQDFSNRFCLQNQPDYVSIPQTTNGISPLAFLDHSALLRDFLEFTLLIFQQQKYTAPA